MKSGRIVAHKNAQVFSHKVEDKLFNASVLWMNDVIFWGLLHTELAAMDLSMIAVVLIPS